MTELSPRQADCLKVIKDFSAKNGYPPTYREIASKLGVSSPNAVYRHVRGLKKKGVLTNSGCKARGFQVAGRQDEMRQAYMLISMLVDAEDTSEQKWLVCNPAKFETALAWLKRNEAYK